ncbi:MAG: hypothetical protein ABSD38_10565 [Syntrophorhabdales bacterium]|jgi:hypothetical protein
MPQSKLDILRGVIYWSNEEVGNDLRISVDRDPEHRNRYLITHPTGKERANTFRDVLIWSRAYFALWHNLTKIVRGGGSIEPEESAVPSRSGDTACGSSLRLASIGLLSVKAGLRVLRDAAFERYLDAQGRKEHTPRNNTGCEHEEIGSILEECKKIELEISRVMEIAECCE